LRDSPFGFPAGGFFAGGDEALEEQQPDLRETDPDAFHLER
jgi:hypothetical protein